MAQVSRMFQRIARGEKAIGSVLREHGDEWVEVMGYVGMDFLCIDFMITSLDWSHAAQMVRTCNTHEVTPWIRLQAFPWGDNDLDPRLTADVLRAISIGVEVVMASVSTPRAVAAILEPAKDLHHRRFHLFEPIYPARHGIERRDDRRNFPTNKPTMVLPCIESVEGIEKLDEIMEVEGLQGIFLGMGDLTRIHGCPNNTQDPKIRNFFLDVVARAKKRNIMVFLNVLPFPSQEEESPVKVGESAKWYMDNGATGVWVSMTPTIIQRFYERVLHVVDAPAGGK